MTMNLHLRIAGLVVSGAAALFLSACASSGGGRSGPVSGEAAPTGALVDARNLPVFDGMTGGRLDWGTLVARIVAADVVLVGELHGHEVGGAASVALFEDVLAHGGSGAALSLEFLERDAQVDVDDYLRGITDEKAFRERTGRSEGNYPAAHRAMVEAAKGAGREVIAGNAPRRYVTIARTKGFAELFELTPSQRQLFVVPELLTEGGYRDRFYELMAGMVASHAPAPEHKPPGEGDDAAATASQANLDAAASEMILGYYRAQNVWDATMAASIASAAGRGRAPVVQVVGQFHIDFDGGLAQRVRALMPGARVVTVSLVEGATMADEDRGRADILVCIGKP